MGEFVSGVATAVLERLATKADKEITLAWNLKNDVQRLQDSMRIINAFLRDAENKQDRDNGITEWLQLLKHVFLDADDALDEIECEALRNEVVKNYGSLFRKVFRFFSSSNKIAFSIKMAHKIKEIRERIDEIASLRTNFGLVGEHHAPDLLPQRETHSHVVPSLVIGRDEEKEKIIDFLISAQSLDSGIDVIAIVGIGGLGKTTLAKLVYNDERVKRHFDLQAWVCISVEFDVKSIMSKILKSLESLEKEETNLTLEQVQTRLRSKLHQKTFLIVMDDVWNDDRKKWLELSTLLMNICADTNKNDSKIIITTRENNVALITRTASAPQIILRELSEDECLKVFLEHAFSRGEGQQYPRLVKIGKEIVRKCKGVPLAVVSLGCLLYSKVDENEWKKVRDSEIWELDDDGILSALRLSYNHLPPQLKQCVSYCSIFPKDYNYCCMHLISFWQAHGLLQPKNEMVQPEDLGDLYIKELLSRFFFQDVEEFDIFPGLIKFKMHDLVHDLAMSTMQSERAIVTSEHADFDEKVRHLLFSDIGVTHYRQPLRKVRTIGLSHSTARQRIITEPFVIWISNEFKYLRMLDLQGSQLKSLPNCFSKMKHLKFLDLTGCSELEEIPASICKLQSLQTFSVTACFKLQRLPKYMANLVSLRALFITTRETHLYNIGIGCMKSLQVLGISWCLNLVSLPSDLSHLTALKKLTISNCPKLACFEENPEHTTVKDLSLRGLFILNLPKLAALPSWLKRSARSLRQVSLLYCTSLTELPEWLPNLMALEILKIIGCRQLVSSCRSYGLSQSRVDHIPNVILDDDERSLMGEHEISAIINGHEFW